MTLSISTYTDPGTFITEVIVPGSINVSSERVMCVVGIGPRTRRSTDEGVIRGKVYSETPSGWTVSTPFRALLASVSDRNRNNAVLYMNGNAMGYGDWEFVPAYLTGGKIVVGPSIDTTTMNLLTVSLDGKDPVRLQLTTRGVGTAITVIATELNAALAAIPAYGAAYSAVFTTTTVTLANDTLNITSPISTSASDVKIFLSPPIVPPAVPATDMASLVSATVWAPSVAVNGGVQAATRIHVFDAAYSSTATYTIDYCTVSQQVDPLTYAATATPLSALLYVGSYPGATSYTQDLDYEDNSNNIDWQLTGTVQAVLSGIAGPYTLVVSASDRFYLSINGLTPITISITPGVGLTAAAIATEINTQLTGSTVYGPEYGYCAYEPVAGTLGLRCPVQFENFPVPHGYASSIVIYDGTRSAALLLFGLSLSATVPSYEKRGTGSRPSFGSAYYVTYNYTRATTDYSNPVRCYNPDQLFAFTSPLTLSNYTVNKVGIAGAIAFENNAPSVWVQLINDSTAPGYPTSSQIHAAIDNCGNKTGLTDVVVLDTSLDTAVYLQSHVSSMSSMLNKKYRRGWFGMSRGTSVGDPDTANTLVYRAVRTLQPGNTSPGRGRQLLIAPCEATRTVTLEDNREIDVDVDGSYIAVAWAALFTSLPSPSDTLLNKIITGFRIDDDSFETYLAGERRTLADKGVFVTTLDAGRLIGLDPITTEDGGGRVVQFAEPASSAQKDAVTNTVDSLITNNLVGIVPDDLADFLVDIKQYISLGIQASINNGTIGPYRNADNTIRSIDPKTDIQVYQSSTDPRTYYFKYWYNLRYPAKRFFGEYSVDNPFFTATA